MTLAAHIDRLARKASEGRIRMQILTSENLKALPPIKGQEGRSVTAFAYVKFFGGGRWTWYVTEASAIIGGEEVALSEVTDPAKVEDVQFFGYVISGHGIDCDEFAYFRLSDLAPLRFPPFGLALERDRYFTPTTLSELPEVEARERVALHGAAI